MVSALVAQGCEGELNNVLGLEQSARNLVRKEGGVSVTYSRRLNRKENTQIL